MVATEACVQPAVMTTAQIGPIAIRPRPLATSQALSKLSAACPHAGATMPHLRASPGQSGSGILPRIHPGQAAGSRFHFHSAFMVGGSGVPPLEMTQPEPRRLCHVSAG